MKYALIGCGMIGPNHLEAAVDNQLEIVALCDLLESNQQRMLEYIPEEQWDGITFYTDYRQMLAEQKPELVGIALGSGLKRAIAVDCMRAGANVIVEKPIALSLKDADEMIATAEECNVRLCVNHQLRFVPTVRALKAEVENGYFGRLYHGSVQVRRNRNKAYFDAGKWRGSWAQDGGTLMNQCIHYTDLLQWIMGSPVTEVFAYTDRLGHPYVEAEDQGLALIRFANGAYGTVEGTINAYPRNLSDAMTLFGERGTVSLQGKLLDEVEAWRFAEGPQTRDEAVDQFQTECMGEWHTPLYQDMIQAIENHRTPLCTGEEGRKALELILAFYLSAAKGQPVQLPIPETTACIDFLGMFDSPKNS